MLEKTSTYTDINPKDKCSLVVEIQPKKKGLLKTSGES